MSLCIFQILLSQLTGKAKYRMAVRHYCDSAARDNHTPKGLLYINKNDTLGLAAHAAFLCLQAAHVADTGDLLEYRCFAKQQIDYMLGSTGKILSEISKRNRCYANQLCLLYIVLRVWILQLHS